MPMTVETYRALGLDRQPLLEMNGRGAADFRLSLNHPGDGCYHPCPEASPAEDTPVGEVAVHRGWDGSRLYTGTRRDLFVYTPAGFDHDRPANLIVFNDGVGYLSRQGAVRATRVLDTLHARGEIAPTVGGVRQSRQPARRRRAGLEQRRREYDPLTETYGRFLLEELLPFAEAGGACAHRGSRRPTVCGISSGGICAFTVAWLIRTASGRVLSHCGSFVNIDGGHNYPFLVRSTPRKPIRVLIQDGANDGRNVYGDWPLANQTMANALEFAGYDVRFEFGTGGHTLRHGGAIFADSLRWLWRAER